MREREDGRRGSGWEDTAPESKAIDNGTCTNESEMLQDFRLLGAKQWVHKIVANRLDLRPSCQSTLGSQQC